MPEVRDQYRNKALRQFVTPLTEQQRSEIEANLVRIEQAVQAMAHRWGIVRSDWDELFSGALEIVCRRAVRLDFSLGEWQRGSFLVRAAINGMRWTLKWGPLKRPNTVYLADDDTDGRQLFRRGRGAEFRGRE